MKKYEQLKKAVENAKTKRETFSHERASFKGFSKICNHITSAENRLHNYERNAAAMHEELVKALQVLVEGFPCTAKCDECVHVTRHLGTCDGKQYVDLLRKATANNLLERSPSRYGPECPSCGRDNSEYGNICASDDCPANDANEHRNEVERR